MSKDKSAYICGGCIVIGIAEHRCWRDETDNFSNRERKMCECAHCRDMDDFMELTSEQKDKVLKGNYNNVKEYLQTKEEKV